MMKVSEVALARENLQSSKLFTKVVDDHSISKVRLQYRRARGLDSFTRWSSAGFSVKSLQERIIDVGTVAVLTAD